MAGQYKIDLFRIELLFLVALFASLEAQTATGRFLLLKPSAVSNSMGGTGVAMVRSPFASYFNPAVLAFSPTLSLAGSFGNPIPFLDNVGHSYFTGSIQLADIGTIGASGNLYWKGDHVRTDDQGSVLSSENIMDWQMKLSFAHGFSEDIGIGMNVGILRLNLSEAGGGQERGKGRATSVVMDAGLIYRNVFSEATFVSEIDETEHTFYSLNDQSVHSGFSFGLAFTNIGPSITFIDPAQSDPLPSTVTFGFAYSPVRTKTIGAMITADAENQFTEGALVDYIHWGTETIIERFIVLRGGYFMDTSGPANSYWTYGAGLRFRFLHINYARYTRALIPSWQLDGAFLWEF